MPAPVGSAPRTPFPEVWHRERPGSSVRTAVTDEVRAEQSGQPLIDHARVCTGAGATGRRPRARLEEFIRQYYRWVPEEELVGRGEGDVCGAALTHWDVLIGGRLHRHWLRDRIVELPRGTYWEAGPALRCATTSSACMRS